MFSERMQGTRMLNAGLLRSSYTGCTYEYPLANVGHRNDGPLLWPSYKHLLHISGEMRSKNPTRVLLVQLLG